MDQPVLLGGPVAKCYVNCCFVAPVRNGLKLLQRWAVEHEGMQAAFACWRPLRLHPGNGLWEKAISGEGSQRISAELTRSNWANEVVLFSVGSQGQELKPQMQSPSLRWQREEKTTYLLTLEKREEPFPLTAPPQCLPSSWKCWFSVLTWSMTLEKDLFSQEKREFKILDPCMWAVLPLLRDLQCLDFFAAVFLLCFGELS